MSLTFAFWMFAGRRKI